MANNVNIQINLDDKQAIQDLQKLANSFNAVGQSATQAGQAAQGVGKLNAQAKTATANTKTMDSALNNFGAKFITFELAKKVGEYANATLTAAAANDQITGKTKETALAYVEIKNNVSDIAQGMVLATANIASSAFEVIGLNDLLNDTAVAWREIAGLKQKSTEANDKANAYNIELQKLSALTREYKTLNGEYERYKTSNAEFAATAKRGMGEVESQINSQNAALAKYGKSLDDATLSALKLGQTSASSIMSGEYDKKSKLAVDAKAKAKAAYDAEQTQLKSIAEAVKASYGSQYDVIERTYNKEVDGYKRALDAKKISLDEYNDATVKSLERRNAAVNALDSGDYVQESNSGEAAQAAYEQAKRAADVRAQEEKNAKDAADKAVQIDKDKQTKIQELEKQTAQMREDSINTFMGGFANLSATMAQQNRKYAGIAKAVAIAEATVNTYQGFTKALAQGGIFGAVAGAGVLASGFASVASIKAQRFALGGVVDGASYTGDKVPVQVNSGEMILTKSQQAQLFNVANGSNTGNVSAPVSITFNVGSGADSVNLRKILNENSGEFARQVAKAIRNPSFATAQGAF